MFGTARDPAAPTPAETKPTQPLSILGEQAQSFFAGYGGKVSAASNPRPVRPGAPGPQRAAPARQPAGPAHSASFAAITDDAARARAEAEAAEAEIVDDAFFDCDAPGY